jgi:hypothetical protein
MKIFKYVVPVEGAPVIPVKGLVKILHFGQQSNITGDDIYMWAMIDPKAEKITDVRLRIFGTGHEFDGDEDMEFIQTVQMVYPDGRQLVWHIFVRV